MQRVNTGRNEADRGATAVFAALLLVVIVGFAGLSLDVASAWAKEQELQNGADAAAFALAQEYAPDCDPDTGYATPYVRANVRNHSSAAGASNVECGPNWVQVTATGPQQNTLLQVVPGVPDDFGVSAVARVEWGNPVSGEVFPLAFSECIFDAAISGVEVDGGYLVEAYIPKDETSEVCPKDEDGGYPPGGFGWLDTTGCTYVDVSLDDPWVDGEPGNADKTGCNWADYIGSTILIPIFDKWDSPAQKQMRIARFAGVELLGVSIQAPPYELFAPGYGTGYCEGPADPSKEHKTCVLGKFVGYVGLDEFELGGEVTDPETLIIRLTSPASE